MSKNLRKKNPNNKLKRTILGTLSAVFMVSAIIIAVVPVTNIEAVDETTCNHVIVADPDINIPQYSSGENPTTPVFSSSDGLFRMA